MHLPDAHCRVRLKQDLRDPNDAPAIDAWKRDIRKMDSMMSGEKQPICCVRLHFQDSRNEDPRNVLARGVNALLCFPSLATERLTCHLGVFLLLLLCKHRLTEIGHHGRDVGKTARTVLSCTINFAGSIGMFRAFVALGTSLSAPRALNITPRRRNSLDL